MVLACRLTSIPTLALALAMSGVSGILIASSSTPVDAMPSRVVYFNDGDVLSGLVEGETIHITEGQRIMVDGDLTLEATGWLRLDGDLVAMDAGTEGTVNSDAPSITLTSDTRITIKGLVKGGQGKSYEGVSFAESVGLNGGKGSDILI